MKQKGLRCRLGIHQWGSPILTDPTAEACRQKVQICQRCTSRRILESTVHEWGEWEEVDLGVRKRVCLHCATVKVSRLMWRY